MRTRHEETKSFFDLASDLLLEGAERLVELVPVLTEPGQGPQDRMRGQELEEGSRKTSYDLFCQCVPSPFPELSQGFAPDRADPGCRGTGHVPGFPGCVDLVAEPGQDLADDHPNQGFADQPFVFHNLLESCACSAKMRKPVGNMPIWLDLLQLGQARVQNVQKEERNDDPVRGKSRILIFERRQFEGLFDGLLGFQPNPFREDLDGPRIGDPVRDLMDLVGRDPREAVPARDGRGSRLHGRPPPTSTTRLPPGPKGRNFSSE